LPGPLLSLTTPIKEQLVLRTVEGAVDLLAGELHQLVSITILRSLTSSVSIRISGDLQDLYGCPLYSCAAIPLPGDPGETSFLEPLRASAAKGVLAALNQPVTFRAPASLAAAITQEFGWRNDPSEWNVNLTESTSGWMAEVGPLFWTKRFGRLERLPWSTNPVVAEVVVRLAKIRPGIARVLTDDGRSVLLTEDKRLLRDAVARTRGLKIVRERVLRFNGATPTAFVLAPNRSRRTTTSARR
jgi:tRNA (guanine6-N2)-methyltransferase